MEKYTVYLCQDIRKFYAVEIEANNIDELKEIIDEGDFIGDTEAFDEELIDETVYKIRESK